MNVYEMEGFLRGKCLPGDMKVNESNAQYLVRKFSELQSQNADMAVQLANAESKCRELAAELSAVDKIHNEAVFITDDHYEQCPPEVQKMIRSLAVLQIPAYDAFLAEVRAQGVAEYASKRGFSFQHGSIHAHFGNGDVMVGSVTFENGDAGINFAPVREKTGGVGTHYDWTKGKTAEQVDSIFVIASSNAEGLEVIRDKLSEAIAQLRKGAAL
ncbi:hypothetical protein [Citrobacter freundii]|uniref:hypothetical protein n=1 Tax=Citrobacter freundii TaxID=546 RepID=UPI001FFE163F|nr:hypothetical protein [Citrobacter freundii]